MTFEYGSEERVRWSWRIRFALWPLSVAVGVGLTIGVLTAGTGWFRLLALARATEDFVPGPQQ